MELWPVRTKSNLFVVISVTKSRSLSRGFDRAEQRRMIKNVRCRHAMPGRRRGLSGNRTTDYCPSKSTRSYEKNFGGYRGLNNSPCRAGVAPADLATRQP